MKTLSIIFVSIFLLSSCSGEETDPQPKVNCEQLKKDRDRAQENLNNLALNRPWDNMTQEVKDKWTAQMNAAKKAFQDAELSYAKGCR